jgi:hypothetical protein
MRQKMTETESGFAGRAGNDDVLYTVKVVTGNVILKQE